MLFLWQGQKDLVSPAGSVGASASQRSPPETRAPRHAPRASDSNRFTFLHKQKTTLLGGFLFMAGAEGLEPSARGFGAKTEKHTKLSCFNKRGASSQEVADDSTTNCQNKLSERSISVTPKARRQKQEEEGKKQEKPMQKSIEPDMKSGAICCFILRGSCF